MTIRKLHARFRRLFLGVSVATTTPTIGLAALIVGETPMQSSSSSRALVEPVLPQLPLGAASGGEVLLDVEVAPDGQVTDINILRTTPRSPSQ